METEQPGELETIWDEAKTYIEQGNFDKAIEIYKYILIRYPGEKVAVEYANAYLGDVYLTLHQPDLAEGYIKKAVQSNPNNPGYRYQLGVSYSARSLWKKAMGEFKTALKEQPTNAEYLRGLGWAIFNGKDQLAGLDYLLKAHNLDHKNISIINDISVAYMGLFDLETALNYVQQALNIDPQNRLSNSILEKIRELQTHFPTRE